MDAGDPGRSRASASRRLLDHAHASLGPGGGGTHWPPSRRREEAQALENLQRKVATAGRGVKPPLPSRPPADQRRLDNRPLLLQKILSNKPGIVTEQEELGTDWLDSDFIAECLCWHNVYRQRHSVPCLTLCPQLCERAQSWANHLAHTNTFFYQQAKDVGQNLFCRLTNALQTDVTGQEVASYWYSAVRQYNYMKEPDVLHANVNAGHFTQLVWASTKLFGVGKARSRSGKILVVANYRPPGNISGLFQANVLPPVPEGKILVVANYRPPGNISGLFQANMLPPVPEGEQDLTSVSDSDASTRRNSADNTN